MPVYNADSSVSRMLDSIIAQTYENWELIAVDDGSTDKSADILDSYSVSDGRIRVTHRTNDGVSSARQLGQEISTGKYIIHADADDFVEPDMLEALCRKAEATNADVVFCDYFVDDNSGNIKVVIQQPPEKTEDIIKAFFSTLHGSCCNKLVKKNTLERYDVCFPKGINYCEDLLLWMRLFINPDVTVTYLNRAFYHYYFSSESTSICHSYSKKLFNTQVAVLRELESILGPGYSELTNRYKMSIKQGAFEHPIFTSKEYYAIFPELNKDIFKTDMSITNRLCMYISCCISYRLGTSLYKLKNKITGH